MIKIKREDLINYIKDNIDTDLDFTDIELNLDTRDERGCIKRPKRERANYSPYKSDISQSCNLRHATGAILRRRN